MRLAKGPGGCQRKLLCDCLRQVTGLRSSAALLSPEWRSADAGNAAASAMYDNDTKTRLNEMQLSCSNSQVPKRAEIKAKKDPI